MIFNNTIWALLGMGLFAISQWGTIIVISKILGPEALGLFSFAMAIANPVFSFSNLQLKAHYATGQEKVSSQVYSGVRLLTSSISFFIVIAICLYNENSLAFLLLAIAVALLKYSDSLSDLSYAIFQRKKLLKRIAISMILRGILGTVVCTIIIILLNNIALGILGGSITWLTVFFLHDIRQVKKLNVQVRPVFSSSSLLLVKNTFSMGVAVMMSSFAMNIPRYYIGKEMGSEQLGIFTAQAYIVTLFGLLAAALSTAISTDLKNSAFENTKQFKKIISLCLAGLFTLTLILVIITYNFGNIITTIIYSADFTQKTSDLLLYLSISCFFWGASCILDYGVISLRKLTIRPFVAISTASMMAITWHFASDKFTNEIGGIMMLVGGITQCLLYLTVILISRRHNKTTY